MFKLKDLGIATVVIGLMTGSAVAAPVLNVSNGHYYEYISSSSSWTDARTAALGMTHLGLTGYLATITDAAENEFIGTLAGNAMIGGTDETTEGTWVWADGPEAGTVFWKNGSCETYCAWNSGEPNNSGDEDYMHRFNSGVNGNVGSWNDLQNGPHSIGYIVEYSGAVGVAEPNTLALFGISLAGLGYMRRRRAA